MNKVSMTELIISKKLEKNLTWEKIGKDLGYSDVWVTSACLGMDSATPDRAKAIADYFGLGAEVATALEAFPTKIWDQMVPTDPLIYRLYEVVGVYGETLKEVIQEKFGDGIMSAIDFKMDMQRQADPNGDRVNIVISGKFLPYKQY